MCFVRNNRTDQCSWKESEMLNVIMCYEAGTYRGLALTLFFLVCVCVSRESAKKSPCLTFVNLQILNVCPQ
jgi:hypothetical protein